MQTIKTRYDQISVGQTLFIKLDSDKKAQNHEVISVRKFGSNCYELMFNQEDGYVGWGERELDLVIE
jgi:hypothetical protein